MEGTDSLAAVLVGQDPQWSVEPRRKEQKLQLKLDHETLKNL